MPHPSLVRLRELRERQALSQGDLGKLAGLHWGTISRLERGGGCQPHTLRIIAKALGVEPAALLAAPKGE